MSTETKMVSGKAEKESVSLQYLYQRDMAESKLKARIKAKLERIITTISKAQ